MLAASPSKDKTIRVEKIKNGYLVTTSKMTRGAWVEEKIFTKKEPNLTLVK